VKKPLISVITVTLNCAQDAVATARTVLSQEFADYEYLVKDGGSTDGTIEAMKEMGIRVVVQPDTGIYDAMNQALALCQGKYVCFLNAGDNFLYTQVLTDVAECIAKDPEVSFVWGDVRDMRFKHRIIKYSPKLTRYYMYRSVITHQAWFLKKDVYLHCGSFDTSFIYQADHDVLVKAILKHKIAYHHIDQPVVEYKYGGQSDLPQAAERLKAERKIILRKNFSSTERLFFGFLFSLRMVPLKGMLIRNKSFRRLLDLYYNAKNIILWH
jgi:putative colanic acid biosynthesis glycosyltransferase